MLKKIRRALRKAKKAVEAAVSAVIGSAAGSVVGAAIGMLVGLDPTTAITIGAIAGGIAGGTAGWKGGIGKGLEAGAGIFRWAVNRLDDFARKGGALAWLLSPFFCPVSMASFLFTEGVNRNREPTTSLEFPLPKTTIAFMKRFFPNLDLDEIQLIDNLNVFPPWANAITFRKKIYFRGTYNSCDFDDAKILLHELVHVQQYQDLGFWTFACRYAHEVLPEEADPTLDVYRVTLETEAYTFEEQHRHGLYREMENHCTSIRGAP